MSLIYITGAPGAGKTTLQNELFARGYDARDLDDSVFGAPHNKVTGEVVTIPKAAYRTQEWFDVHEWRVYPEVFKKLKAETKNKDILILGVASSDNVLLPMFDKIMYLKIDDEVLTNRLRNRDENDYGRNRFELEDIITRKRELDEKYNKYNVIQIDANKSLNEVTQQITSYI